MLPKTMHRVTVCVTLVVLICGAALSSPLPGAKENARDRARGLGASTCSKHAKELLMGLKRALNRTQSSALLFRGFNCTDLDAQFPAESSTVSACQPGQDLTCSGQVSATFNKDECLSSIMSDLDYHHSIITAYMKSFTPDQVELSAITTSIRELQQNCQLLPKRGRDEQKVTETSSESIMPTDSFQARLNMCKALIGFHIRTVTINRALSFISTEENN